MTGKSSGAVVKHLQTLFQSGTAAGLTDGQLLERFVNRGDTCAEGAFAALVERHGPMVLDVCRQVLGDPHDAEDASPTVFLILAHKAGSIRKAESLASWLFGVPCRVAARAKADAARRRAYERRGAEMVARLVDDGGRAGPWPELYEELERLPEKVIPPVLQFPAIDPPGWRENGCILYTSDDGARTFATTLVRLAQPPFRLRGTIGGIALQDGQYLLPYEFDNTEQRTEPGVRPSFGAISTLRLGEGGRNEIDSSRVAPQHMVTGADGIPTFAADQCSGTHKGSIYGV